MNTYILSASRYGGKVSLFIKAENDHKALNACYVEYPRNKYTKQAIQRLSTPAQPQTLHVMEK